MDKLGLVARLKQQGIVVIDPSNIHIAWYRRQREEELILNEIAEAGIPLGKSMRENIFDFALYGGRDGVIVGYTPTVNKSIYDEIKRVSFEKIREATEYDSIQKIVWQTDADLESIRELPSRRWLEDPKKAKSREYMCTLVSRIEQAFMPEGITVLERKYGFQSIVVPNYRRLKGKTNIAVTYMLNVM
ncbi:MAG: hypothetical protein WC254_03415 [Candidatus Woesearchaeota archaeon]|jgi:hypothetical protein